MLKTLEIWSLNLFLKNRTVEVISVSESFNLSTESNEFQNVTALWKNAFRPVAVFVKSNLKIVRVSYRAFGDALTTERCVTLRAVRCAFASLQKMRRPAPTQSYRFKSHYRQTEV